MHKLQPLCAGAEECSGKLGVNELVMATTPILRKRSNSYGRNLHLLKGVNPNQDEDIVIAEKCAAEQNKWLFEVAWEVANKGEAHIPTNLVVFYYYFKVTMRNPFSFSGYILRCHGTCQKCTS